MTAKVQENMSVYRRVRVWSPLPLAWQKNLRSSCSQKEPPLHQVFLWDCPPYLSSRCAAAHHGWPKENPTTNLMFILPWWVQPAQSGCSCLALNWNRIHVNHPSHPGQPVKTKAALIAQSGPGGAPNPMHLAFLIGMELLCLHWL